MLKLNGQKFISTMWPAVENNSDVIILWWMIDHYFSLIQKLNR
jgi:hypothetical protein